MGRAVAQQAIKQVLSDKTVVLATNQLQFVSMADQVVVMRGGTAVEVGGYAELLAAGGVFAALMKEAQVGRLQVLLVCTANHLTLTDTWKLLTVRGNGAV